MIEIAPVPTFRGTVEHTVYITKSVIIALLDGLIRKGF